MTRKKGFNDFSYGVGLEYNANSYKQVKDVLKSNLDSLLKMANTYSNMLKLDPNFDLSKMLTDLRETKQFVDQIKGSGNPFSEFVDKGVLTRIANLEKGIQDLAQKAPQLGEALKAAFDGIKDTGKDKYPGTFSQIFSDKSNELEATKNKIKAATQEIKLLEKTLNTASNPKNVYKLFISDDVTGQESVEQVKQWIGEWEVLLQKWATIDHNGGKEQKQLVGSMKDTASKIISAFDFPELNKALSGSKIDTKKLTDSIIKDFTAAVDVTLKNIKEKKASLEAEFVSLEQLQTKYETQKNTGTGAAVKSDVQKHSTPVALMPKVVPSDWAKAINDKLKEVENQLAPVTLRATFANTSKNLEKDMQGNVAAINHVVKAEFQLDDSNFQKSFNDKIKSIDNSLKNAQKQLASQTKFKLGWEFADGEKFKDIVYPILNQFKNVPVTFKMSNGKAFLSQISELRKNAEEKLKNIGATLDSEKIVQNIKSIPITLAVSNKEALFTEINNIRATIESQLQNIGVGINLSNPNVLPSTFNPFNFFQMMANAMPDNMPKDVGSAGTEDVAKGIETIGAASDKTSKKIQQLEAELKDLKDNYIYAETFLKTGVLGPDRKKKNAESKELKSKVEEFKELSKNINNFTKEQEKRFISLKRYLADVLLAQEAFKKSQLETLTKTPTTDSAQSQADSLSKATEGAKKNSAAIDELNAKAKTLKDTIVSLETEKFNSPFLATGKNKDKIAEEVKQYKDLLPVRQQVNNILHTQGVYLGQNIKKLKDEIATQERVTGSTTEAFKIAKAYYELNSKLKGKQQDNSANKMLEKVANTAIRTKQFTFAGKEDVNNLEKYLPLAKAYDEILQKIGYRLKDLKPNLDSKGNQFGFVAEVEKVSKNAAKSSREAQQILLGNSKAADEAKTKLVSLNKTLQETEAKKRSLEKDGVKSKVFTELGNITSQGKKQGEDISGIVDKYNKLEQVEKSLEETRKRRIKARQADLKNVEAQIKNVEAAEANLGKNKKVNADAKSGTGTPTSTSTPKTNVDKTKKEAGAFKDLNTVLSSDHVQAMKAATDAEEAKRAKSQELTDQLNKELEAIKAVNAAAKNEKKASGGAKAVDTTAAGARIAQEYSNLEKIALNSITDSSITEKGVVGMKPLKDGIVEVSGALKDANDQWKSYTLQIDKNGNVSKFQVKNTQSVVKAYLNQNKAVEESAKSNDTAIEQAKKQIETMDELMARVEQFRDRKGATYKDGNMAAYFTNFQNVKGQLESALTTETANAYKTQHGESGYKGYLLNLVQQAKDAAKKINKELTAAIQGENLHNVGALNQYFEGLRITSTDPATIYEQMSQAVQAYGAATEATSVKTYKLQDANNAMGFSITTADGATQTFTMRLNGLTGAVEVVAGTIGQSRAALAAFSKDIIRAFGSMARYAFGMYSGWYMFMRQIRNGIKAVKDLDAAMTELKKVTDATESTYENFLKNASTTASKIGSTLTEFVNATADFARLGYSIGEASELAEVASIYTNIGDEVDSVDDATKSIISTMKAFQIEATDAIGIVDRFNEVGNRFAITSGGIGEALQRSASALYAAGNTIDESIALITVANSVVQNPETVGTALKTLSLRLRGAKVELEEASLDADNMATSVSSLRDKLLALTGGKVDIMINDDEFKNTTEILREMAEVWDEMSDVSQAAALELMGGKRQANVLAAILTNFDEVESVIETSLESANSAYVENEKYLDSIQGRLDKFNNALQTMWANFIDDDLIKSVVDMGTTILDTFSEVGSGITIIFGSLAATAFMPFLKGFRAWMADTTGTVRLIDALRTSYSGLAVTMQGLFKSRKANTMGALAERLASMNLSKAVLAELEAKFGNIAATETLTKVRQKEIGAVLLQMHRTGDLTTAQYLAAAASLGLGEAIKALWEVLKENPYVAIIATIAGVVGLISSVVNTTEEASKKATEAFEKMRNVVDETKSSIQSLESELSTIQDQIDKLEGKKLSFVEEQELTRLKKQRSELEHSLKTQQQLLNAQQETHGKQAVQTMRAYTKASSEGAEKTRKNWTNAGTAIGAVLGIAGLIGLTVATAGAAAPVALAGLGLGKVAIAGVAGGFIGNKAGEGIGDAVTSNDGTYDSWYETYTKALDASREKEQKALEKYEKDTSNIKKLEKWQDAQEKTIEIESEMYDHLAQMQSYYDGLEYGKSAELDQELDTWYNFLDKFNIDQWEEGSQGGKDAKANAIDRLFGENASAKIQAYREDMEAAIALGEDIDFTKAEAEYLGLTDVLEYLGITVQDVDDYFTNLGESIADAAESGEDFAGVITEIAKIEGAMGAFSSAMEEFVKNGSLTASTLDGMDDSIKSLGDAWNNYVKVMLSGNATMASASRATQELAKAYLDANVSEVTAENKLMYVTQLEKLGVENANDLVDAYITNDFLQSSAIGEFALKFKTDPEGAVDGLVKEAERRGVLLVPEDAEAILSLKADEQIKRETARDAEIEKQVREEELQTIRSISVRQRTVGNNYETTTLGSLIDRYHDMENRTGDYAEDGKYGHLSDETVAKGIDNYKTIIERELTKAGYTWADFIAAEAPVEIVAPSQEEVDAAEKACQDKIDEMELTVTPKIDLNPQDVIQDLSDTESAFESIGQVYDEFLENGVVAAGSLAGLKDTFDLVGMSDEYENFITVLGNSTSTIEQVQDAVYDLANAYLATIRITDDLASPEKAAERALIIEQLTRLGITNAEEWLDSRIKTYEAVWEAYEIDLNNYATVEEAKLEVLISAIAAELNITNQQVIDLANQYGIDLANFANMEAGKVEEAKEAAKQIAAAHKEAAMAGLNTNFEASYNEIKAMSPSEQAKREHILLQQYNADKAKIEAEYNQAIGAIDSIKPVDPEGLIDAWYNPPDIKLDFGSLGGSDGSSAEDTAEQTIDFIEIKLEEIEKLIAKTTAKIENIVDNAASAMTKRALYSDLINAQKSKAQTNNAAASYYSQKAASLLSAVPSQYREMAKNGAISVKDFLGESQTEIAEAIEKYREYDAKADDAEIAALEAIAEVSALRLEAIKDIADDFDNVIGLIDAKSGLLQSNMDLIEESGIRMSEAYYDELIKGASATIAQLTEKQAGIRSDLNAAVASGEIAVGSDDWYEAVNLILECDEAILDCKQSTEEWNNAINELKWENLDKFITELDNVESELSHLYDLLSDDDEVVDDMAKWTDKGITSLGLLAQQMELAQYKSQQYANAIQELEQDYHDGRYSTDEYNEKLAELTENQWEAIEAYEQAKDAIVDLNRVRIDAVKDGIQKEIDAYKKLIDAKKEALDIDKEAHDFERDVAEKQKNIGVIQRQLAAIANDNSAAANAKRKQLQAELLEANSELEEFYYDKSIDDQKNALDKEYEAYEQSKQEEMDALDEWLKQQELVIQESFDLIKANAKIVLETIKSTADEYGVQISGAVSDPWKSGENAISNYEGVFNSTIGNLSASVDSFIGKLNELLDKQNEIIESARNMADSVIDSTNQSFNNATESQNTIVNGWDPYANGDFNDSASGGGLSLSPSGGSGSGSGSSNIQVGGRIHAGNAPIYENINGIPEKQTFDEDPIYNVLKEKGDWVQVRWHKANSGVSGWFKKGDVNAYAKGTLGTQRDEIALIDELGEELQLVPNGQGRLEYLKKGTSVIPADLTERLMEWGALDPTEALNQSRPKFGAPHITTNNFDIDLSFGSLVHVDAVSNDTLPELQKMVRKEFDGLMKGLNNSVKRYTR